jgi:hypothetical protein
MMEAVIGVLISKLYSMEAIIGVLLSKLLLVSSTFTPRTSWLQRTIYRSHIGDVVNYFQPILWSFQNIHVFWSRLLYAEE